MKKLISLVTMVSLFTHFVSAQVNNMGTNINTRYHEIRPLVSGDGTKLYFTKEGGPNVKYKDQQEIWVSKKDSTGNWGLSERLPNIINKNRYNSVYWVSEDGGTLLIRGTYDENLKEQKRGFSITKFVEGYWTEPVSVKIKDYDFLSRGVYTGASLTKDQKVMFMYFSTEKNGETNDLWVSLFNDSTMEYGTPQKLNISQEDYDEISPFIAEDGKTLYFSSDKDGGLGSQDIWVSKRLDNSWMNWSTPTNLGKPFNTKDWDTYLSINQDSLGYYVTNHKHSVPSSMGGADIVISVLPEMLRPEKTIIKKISDFIDANEDGIDDEDGTMMIRDTLYITILKRDSIIERKVIPCNPMDTMSVSQLEKELTRGRIMFDYGSSTLRSDAYRKLDVLIAILNKNGNMKIEIAGHSDSKGTPAGNLKQSKERAESAKGYLIARGIQPNRLIVKGYGNKKSVATNDTDEGRQLNRRVDIYVIQE